MVGGQEDWIQGLQNLKGEKWQNMLLGESLALEKLAIDISSLSRKIRLPISEFKASSQAIQKSERGISLTKLETSYDSG